jgi:hypothetical protein
VVATAVVEAAFKNLRRGALSTGFMQSPGVGSDLGWTHNHVEPTGLRVCARRDCEVERAATT